MRLRRAAFLMNFVEIVRGIGNLAFVMVVAGTVAPSEIALVIKLGAPAAACLESSALHVDDRSHRDWDAHRAGRDVGRDFASQQVKTAFFKMNSINEQITELQARAARPRSEGQ